jgi:hypothetical protein
MMLFARHLQKLQRSHTLGVEDFTVMVTGLERCKLCTNCLGGGIGGGVGGDAAGIEGCGACGLCAAPHVIAEHLRKCGSAGLEVDPTKIVWCPVSQAGRQAGRQAGGVAVRWAVVSAAWVCWLDDLRCVVPGGSGLLGCCRCR